MATSTSPDAVETSTRPVHEIRRGRIIASFWLNQTKHGPLHNVTFQRVYRHNEKWNYSDSFGRDDLPLLACVANLAAEWLYQLPAQQQSADEEAAF